MVCFVVAGFVWWYASRQMASVERTKGWPEVAGTLDFAKYDFHYDHHAERRETINVKYSYQVNEKTYSNDRIAYAPISNKQKYQEFYEHGQVIQVKYDPDNPSDSVLEYGNPMGRTGSLIWVSLLCALGLYLVIVCRESE